MPRKTDKRLRLIDAAKFLFHKQGFNLTTLADIAQYADVPLGNVYYYFKTKDAIGFSVIEQRSIELKEILAKFSEEIDPLERLKIFIHKISNDLELIAQYGCPIGGLCQELSKQGGSLSMQAAKLLHDMTAWLEKQFIELGIGKKSYEYAISLISSIQGAYLLTNTFKDPKIFDLQSNTINEWLDAVVHTKKVDVAAQVF